jgi:hypothetical protein
MIEAQPRAQSTFAEWSSPKRKMLAFDYRFELGTIVHFGKGGRYYEVVWRGELVIGEPGRRSRAQVYWLGADTWDCYFGDELWSIGQYPF